MDQIARARVGGRLRVSRGKNICVWVKSKRGHYQVTATSVVRFRAGAYSETSASRYIARGAFIAGLEEGQSKLAKSTLRVIP
jgi:hypothetical protein